MRLIIFSIIISLTSIAYCNPPIFTSSINDAQKISDDLKIPILTVVSADWCLFCEKLDITISNNLEIFNNIIILKLDFDKNKEYVQKNNIKKIPTIIYRNEKYIGIYDIKEIKKILK